MKKKILVLANSIKKGGRCVAGLELLNNEPLRLGEWIRPIDKTQDEGTINSGTTFIDGSHLYPLDVVEIDFIKNAEDSNHPEDWIIKPHSQWHKLGNLSHSTLNHVPSSAYDKWGNTKGVEPGSFNSTLQLLCLTSSIEVTAEHRHNPFENRSQFKTVTQLPTKDGSFEISVTDPFFTHKHGLQPSSISQEERKTVTLQTGTYLVLSLTPIFHGKQYKVVAAIIEP